MSSSRCCCISLASGGSRKWSGARSYKGLAHNAGDLPSRLTSEHWLSIETVQPRRMIAPVMTTYRVEIALTQITYPFPYLPVAEIQPRIDYTNSGGFSIEHQRRNLIWEVQTYFQIYCWVSQYTLSFCNYGSLWWNGWWFSTLAERCCPVACPSIHSLELLNIENRNLCNDLIDAADMLIPLNRDRWQNK